MDTPEEIARDKWLRQKELERMAMADECERCLEHNESCPFYDPDEEYWDYMDCYEVRG